jgi:putative ABC transport system ATP-binding protein
MSNAPPLAALHDVSKCYGSGDRAVWALRGVSIAVQPGEFVSITGPSGSGKSTLLNLIAGIETPDHGEVRVGGVPIASLADADLARIRRRSLAYVFQFFNLLPTLSAAENVAVPLRADGMSRAEIKRRTERALEEVGLAARAKHYPTELSGGEMQRVAIARALATDARLILADEPTGNLDTTRSEEVLELLRRAVDSDGRSVILVTHDLRAAAYGHRLITLRDGRFVDEVTNRPAVPRSIETSRIARKIK